MRRLFKIGNIDPVLVVSWLQNTDDEQIHLVQEEEEETSVNIHLDVFRRKKKSHGKPFA